MKIVKLQIENFQKVIAAEISPEGNVIMITGKNANGKTSVLNAIWAALQIPRSTEMPKPIHEGADKAVITLDLETYVVRRVFTENSPPRLEVTGAEGASFKSPQSLLDKLLGSLTFDPLAFISMSSKDQVDLLLKMSGSEFDFEANAIARKDHYDKRAEENKAVKAISAAIGAEPEKIDKIDVSVIQKDMEVVRNLASDIKEQTEKLDRYKKAIEEIEQYLKSAKLTFGTYKEYNELEADMRKAIEHNSKAGDWDIWKNSQKNVVTHAEQATIHDNMIKDIDARKEAAMKELKMPYPGLGFDESGVTYSNIPLKQASKAEQIRISMAIAMAANPQIRVLRIEDGSLLDEDNLKLIYELAEKHDYQVWIEAVGSGGVGIYIEDGVIK